MLNKKRTLMFVAIFSAIIICANLIYAASTPVEFGDKQQDITSLLGSGIVDRAISVSNAELVKIGGMNEITIGDGGYLIATGTNENGAREIITSCQNVKQGGKIELDNKGQVIKADITSSKDTIFRFGDQSVSVPKDTRVIFQNGGLFVSGKEGTTFDLNSKTRDESGKVTGQESGTIQTNDPQGVTIFGSSIAGTDFIVGDVAVRGIDNKAGVITITKEGYLLGKSSIADWRGLEITADKKEVNLIKPGIEPEDMSAFDNANYVLPTTRLEAEGEGFQLEFKPNNKWVHIYSNDLLKVNFESSVYMSMYNRGEKEAPLMQLQRNKDSSLIIQDGNSQGIIYQNQFSNLKYAGKDFYYSKPVLKEILGPPSDTSFDTVPIEIEDSTVSISDEKGNKVPLAQDVMVYKGSKQNGNYVTLPAYLAQDNSWFIDRSGSMIPSKYDATVIDNPAAGASFSNGGDSTFDLKMNVLGDVKYPAIMATELSDPSNSHSPFVYQLDTFNSNDYYIDEQNVNFIFKNMNSLADYNNAGNNRMYQMEGIAAIFPNNAEVKKKIYDMVGNTRDLEFTIREENGGRTTKRGDDNNVFENSYNLLYNYPALQSELIKKTSFSVDSYSADSGFPYRILRNAGGYHIADDFIDKYYPADVNPELNKIKKNEFDTLYFIYRNFDERFPEFRDYGLTDREKFDILTSTIGRVQATEIIPEGASGIPIDAIRIQVDNFVKQKEANPTIITKRSPVFSYVYGNDGSNLVDFQSDSGLLRNANFDNLVERKTVDYRRDMKSTILKDISDPENVNGVYVFNNHGGSNGQYLGYSRPIESPEKNYIMAPLTEIKIAPDELADALYKRYNPTERSFGNPVIVLNSCYSQDYIDKTYARITQKLESAGVDYSKVKLPVMISLTTSGNTGAGSMNSYISNSIKDHGSFTFNDFVDMNYQRRVEERLNPSRLYMGNAIGLPGTFQEGRVVPLAHPTYLTLILISK